MLVLFYARLDYNADMRKIVIIAHDIRSAHNVGALLRTADCMGVSAIYFTGYTPFPRVSNDPRLPHQIQNTTAKIAKTALGAERTVNLCVEDDVNALIRKLKKRYQLIALEQHKNSKKLPDFSTNKDVALLLGREVEGIDEKLLSSCDDVVEIPILGSKESLNVTQAAAIALYHFRFVI